MVDVDRVKNVALNVPSRIFRTHREAFQELSMIWSTPARSTRLGSRAESKFSVRVKVVLDVFKHDFGPLFKA